MAGHTYYISPTGNDLAAGTSAATAWKTIARVNAATLGAGDSVLFQGGKTFNGTLALTAADAATTAAPITISSYGTGRAEIYAGAADGIDVFDTSGVAISNLNIEGSSPSNDTSQGINLYNDRTTGGRLANGVSITQVDVGGFGLRGIGIGAATTTYGFDHVSVTYATLHDDDEAGLYSYAGAYTTNPAPYGLAHADLYVAYVTAYHNAGNTIHLASGDGIELGDVTTATIEHCVAYANGLNREGGPVGIWTYNSDRVTIQYNESYGNEGGKTDGDGFDLDGGTTDAIVQYNYSHDNGGAAVLLCQFANANAWGNNVVRYNVSQNDGALLNYPGIEIYAPSNSPVMSNTEIYGNTIYASKTGSNTPRGISIDANTLNFHIRNNLFDVTAGGLAISVQSAGTGLLFQGNDYWTQSTTNAGLRWGVNTYTTLAAWRSATGEEKVGTTATGLAVNPLLAAPGTAGTIGPGANLATKLSAYRLSTASPLVNAGVNLTSLGVAVPATDFFGQPVPDGAGFDIGADEVDATPPTARASLGAVTLGSAGYTFTVTYTDNIAVYAASITNGDLKVTGPNGYGQSVKLVSHTGSGTSITATYSITAPGGTWDKTDAGTYTITVVAGQVVDTSNNWLAATAIGTFVVP
jgi:hypothetical protein